MKRIKIIGYILILAPVSFALFATMYDIPIEKEAIIACEVIALYFLFRELIKLDKK